MNFDATRDEHEPVPQTPAPEAGPTPPPDIDNPDALSREDMEQLYDQSLDSLKESEVVRGTILQINEDEVVVDIGGKSEGIIPIEEFRRSLEAGSLKVGDEIDVYIDSLENTDGLVVLSKEKADKIKIWDEITRAYENGEVIDGVVVERIKGGLTVDIGVRAFLPGSQIDLRPVRDPENLIGTRLQMKIIKLNKRRGNIVLSRRVILEEERERLKRDTLARLEPGAMITGTVKNITEYGAFIDLGGIDGLLHITDMSWGRVNHPSELFMIGDRVEVKILKFDPETERVSLGLKQKSPDPWETVAEKFPISSRVRGKVISLTDYGAFLELEEGIEGLVHISEMSWTRRVRNPAKMVAVGDFVEAVVQDVDLTGKRISLSMKQIEPNPWSLVQEKYPLGTRVTGRVRNLTNFGAFVELEEGIDGLIHISDMSWTKRINHPSEVLKKGELVETLVLDVDVENERLSLGLKQAYANPWDQAPARFAIGTDVEGTVVRITDFGVFVELEEGIEGLVHISELDRRRVSRPEEVVAVGDRLKMKVIKIDPEERRIGLSVRAFREVQERQAAAAAPAGPTAYRSDPDRAPRSTLRDAIDSEELLRNIALGRSTPKPEVAPDATEAGEIPEAAPEADEAAGEVPEAAPEADEAAGEAPEAAPEADATAGEADSEETAKGVAPGADSEPEAAADEPGPDETEKTE